MIRIKHNPQVIWDMVDGVMVLYKVDSAELFELNDTGGVMWRVCDEDTLEEAVRRVHQIYPDQDLREIDATVRNFFQSLEAVGLISVQDEQTK